MTREEFNVLYEHHRPGLDRALAELKRLLKQGLDALNQNRPGLFRIRLTEARVKEADSLYDKILDDGLDPARAFEPHYVRDLLGARLICHNLSDVEQLAKAFRQGRFADLHHIDPPKGEKVWLHVPQPGTGYRAWHLDVRWSAPTKEGYDYAEIQMRTLLQDAWAMYMHDDVHKAKNKVKFPQHVFERLQEFSDLLYAADGMARGIRGAVESLKVSEDSNIRRLEAVNQAMFFMVNFFAQPRSTTSFITVERIDEYVVERAMPRFRFTITGQTPTPEQFSMLIGGDTPNRNFELLQFENSGKAINPSDYVIHKNPEFVNTVLLEHLRGRRKRHEYSITCVWKGVFDEGREYVWCPWSQLYRQADVAYTLRLRFSLPPKRSPILYRLRDFGGLSSVLRAFESDGPEGSRPERTEDTLFEFRPERARDNFLCLFVL